MVRIALLSNPKSTGNRAQLPAIRSFCANHPEIFHYEVEHVDQIEAALRTIARVDPRILVINGGDGTVQATLTELYHSQLFGDAPPPVAVLPNGKTNLIALDLGANGDAIGALQRVLEIAQGSLEEHIVTRELIALSQEDDGVWDGLKPTIGMFLGGAGLAEVMLWCRNKVYPLGLPNWLSHAVTLLALIFSLVLGMRAAFLPERAAPLKVSLIRQGQLQGSFSLLIVTTLRKLLVGSKLAGRPSSAGALQLMIVEQSAIALVCAFVASLFGKLESQLMRGIHVRRGDEIRIEGDRSSVILDGELFHASAGRSIVLRQTAPLPFVRLAA
ncbi:diacylglycerol/lipid kinase family protein [Sphingomonas nostoxanthinifaciens]|uniref:diacylglycerol/lipid kinase family protein n=1 Tax=Sphingomonas nostoxanthinifaciens TaxID=2872652 RepID=UPI001CC1E485|nr:acylglycerol kinase family protein [Sphingomonas nostoxanthinifaciens]UAK23403.1 acylglycerol kinase family protein [Sphingomonas nostoxanthinifaciens]